MKESTRIESIKIIAHKKETQLALQHVYSGILSYNTLCN